VANTVRAAAEPVTAGPVAAPRIVRQRRVRAGHLGLAVLLVALGGLLAGFAFIATARTNQYLAVARDVSAGAQLTAEDITTVTLAIPAREIKPIAAIHRKLVVGKRAAVTLLAGTLLTEKQITDQSFVGAGQKQIGIGFKTDRLPARELREGDRVLLVSSTEKPSGNSSTPPVQENFEATVVGTGEIGTDNTRVVYLAIDERIVNRVVQLAAESRLYLVLLEVR